MPIAKHEYYSTKPMMIFLNNWLIIYAFHKDTNILTSFTCAVLAVTCEALDNHQLWTNPPHFCLPAPHSLTLTLALVIIKPTQDNASEVTSHDMSPHKSSERLCLASHIKRVAGKWSGPGHGTIPPTMAALRHTCGSPWSYMPCRRRKDTKLHSREILSH